MKPHCYTDDELDFIHENEGTCQWEELCKKFNTKFGCNLRWRTLHAAWRRRQKQKIFRYTDEQLKWLSENYSKMNRKELTAVFNRRFSENRTESSLASACKKRGFGRKQFFTEEQKAWLLEKGKSIYSREEIQKQFNEKFHEHRTLSSIRSICDSVGGQFTGQRPYFWMRGKRGSATLGKRTTLSRKHKPGDIFSMKTSRGNDSFYRPYIMLYDDPDVRFMDRVVPYSRYVWEQHNGPLKDGQCVVHLDLDEFNNDISNLAVISKYETSLLGRIGWNQNPEIFKTGIKILELDNLLKEKEVKR